MVTTQNVKNSNPTCESVGDQEQNTEWSRHRKPEKPMSDGKNLDFYAHLHTLPNVIKLPMLWKDST